MGHATPDNNQPVSAIELCEAVRDTIESETKRHAFHVSNEHFDTVSAIDLACENLAVETLNRICGKGWDKRLDSKLAPDSPSDEIIIAFTNAISKAYGHSMMAKGPVNIAENDATINLQDFTTALDYWKDLEKSAELVGYSKLDDWQERRAFWKEFGQDTTLKVLAEQTKDEIKDHLKDAAKEFLGEKGKEQFEHFTKGGEAVEAGSPKGAVDASPPAHLEASPNGSSTIRLTGADRTAEVSNKKSLVVAFAVATGTVVLAAAGLGLLPWAAAAGVITAAVSSVKPLIEIIKDMTEKPKDLETFMKNQDELSNVPLNEAASAEYEKIKMQCADQPKKLATELKRLQKESIKEVDKAFSEAFDGNWSLSGFSGRLKLRNQSFDSLQKLVADARLISRHGDPDAPQGSRREMNMKDAMVIAIKHREIEDKVFANRCGVSLAKHYSVKLGVATVIVGVGAAMVAVPVAAAALGTAGAAIAVGGISVATRTAGVLLENAINKSDQSVDPATRYSISAKLQAMRDEHNKSKANGPSTPPAFA